MDESTPDIETGLPHHKKAWSQHDLLASTLSEYVDVLQKNGGRWPSWQIAPSSDDVHADIVRLNVHLEKLGWMAKLTKDEQWVVTVFPAPERQFPRRNTVLLFWGLSLLTLTLAGDHWMSNARPTEGWFHSSAFIDALLGYTLPVLSVLFVASMVQRSVAGRYGVRSGHLMPVPDFTIALYALGLFPSNWLFWPFGLLLIPTMPRMDARPWPDRASLGYTALSVPLVLGGTGAIMMIAGMSLTPEYLASSTMPLISTPPLFLSLLAEGFLSNDAFIRLLWAHPWVHAGGMLLLFAWISILPIPTFPGGRLLIARMGLFDARSSSTQTLILVTMLFCAYVFGVFDQFSLWYLVFALLLPLVFFFGNDLRVPLILDETEGLTEADHSRMGLLVLLVFLLLLPAAQPVLHESTWDDPLNHRLPSPEPATLQDDGTWLSSTEVRINNPSALMKPYAVTAYLETPGQGWTVTWDCDGEDTYDIDGQGCGADLLPQRTAFFWMNLTWTGPEQPTMANLSYVVNLDGVYEVEEVRVRPALAVVPAGHWYDVSVGPYMHRCIELNGTLMDSTRLNISVGDSSINDLQTQLVTPVGGPEAVSNLTQTPSKFCLEGLDPLVFEPSMSVLTLNNDTFAPISPPRRTTVAHVPEGGWTIYADDGPTWGALLSHGVLSKDLDHCPIDASISTPARPQDGSAWIWDMDVRTSGPLIQADQNLTLLVPDGANLTLCKEAFNPYPALSFTAVEGPELLISWMNTTTRFWTTPWAVATGGTVLNTGMNTFTLHNPSNTSIPFRLDRGGSFGEDWGHNWDGQALAPGDTLFDLTPPSAPLATMWLTYESGSVVLHLSSYQ
ncbi:MAG: hypothetical protein CMB34_00745 [Euryarchaeota archaeon]|nr:hypothetical protein [Euryarchaeota archaeon]